MAESRVRILARRGLAAATLLVAAALAAPALAQPQTAAPPASSPGATATATATTTAPLAAQDPALEARMLKVAEELRCLVCQNETIAASHADLAVDLRQQIRVKLKEGLSERQILDFMVQRYGDFVLYRPPLKTSTMLLWIGPFVLLIVAGATLLIQIRKRRQVLAAQSLSPEEAQRARRLLDEPGSEAPRTP